MAALIVADYLHILYSPRPCILGEWIFGKTSSAVLGNGRICDLSNSSLVKASCLTFVSQQVARQSGCPACFPSCHHVCMRPVSGINTTLHVWIKCFILDKIAETNVAQESVLGHTILQRSTGPILKQHVFLSCLFAHCIVH